MGKPDLPMESVPMIEQSLGMYYPMDLRCI